MRSASTATCRPSSTEGKPETAAYVGNTMEAYEKDSASSGRQSLYLATWSGPETMQRAVEHIAKLGPGVRRVGIEAAFIPADAEKTLRGGFSERRGRRCVLPARAPARRQVAEGDRVSAARFRARDREMHVVYASRRPGKTKQELAEALRVRRSSAASSSTIA